MESLNKHLSFSIITPTFNQGQYIEQTIQSVLNQNYSNLEYVIIDGGSTDNTVEIIKKYERHLKYWVSEKDKGQANAINKGLQQCTGEIFNWLNSDDYIEPGALQSIANAFADDTQMVAGKVRIFEKKKSIEFVQHKNLSARGLMNWVPGVQFVQPGVWLRRKLIQECGGIDDTLHYSFDWDLYIRYLSKFASVKYIDDLLIHFRYHDQSKTISSPGKFHQEGLKIIQKLAAQTADKNLQKIARESLSAKELYPALKNIVNDNNKNHLKKMMLLAGKINKRNWPHLRAIGGAIKKVLAREKIT